MTLGEVLVVGTAAILIYEIVEVGFKLLRRIFQPFEDICMICYLNGIEISREVMTAAQLRSGTDPANVSRVLDIAESHGMIAVGEPVTESFPGKRVRVNQPVRRGNDGGILTLELFPAGPTQTYQSED